MSYFILSVTAAIVFIAYVLNEVRLFGIPKSISNSYYLYNTIKKNLGYVFSIFMIGLGIFLTPLMLEISKGSEWQFVSFFFPAGLIFCGMAPESAGTTAESKIHSVSAIIAAICGLTWSFIFLSVTHVIYYLVGIGIIVFLIADYTKTIQSSKIFWIEIISFGTIMLSLITYTGNLI